ncbi:MAG: LptF/LptG family permease, partial [Pseudomonadota bacterium]|nr:LptF/LptG family permease [Pseudomonadota bacterium]
MPRYARYLFKQYLIAFLIFTLMFGGMVYIVQSVQLLDKIDGRIDSLVYFFGLTLLLLPKLFVHVMPLSMLAALVSVKQRMINDNELVILSTSGQNRWQLAAPGLLLCLGVTVFLALMEFQVQPMTMQELREKRKEIADNLFVNLIKPGTFSEIGKGLTVYVNSISDKGFYENIIIYDATKEDRSVVYIAESAEIVQNNNQPGMRLVNGKVFQDLQNDIKGSLSFEEYVYQSTLEPKKTTEIRFKTDEMYLGDLLSPPNASQLAPKTLRKYEISGHKRIANTLTPLIIGLIVSACILTGIFGRTGNKRRVSTCIIVTLGFYIIAMIFAGLAESKSDIITNIYTPPVFALIIACLYLQFGGSINNWPPIFKLMMSHTS